MYVGVPIVSETQCTQSYKKFGGITSRMICAGYEEGEKDACQVCGKSYKWI